MMMPIKASGRDDGLTGSVCGGGGTTHVVTIAAKTPRMKLFHTSHKARIAVLFISVKQ